MGCTNRASLNIVPLDCRLGIQGWGVDNRLNLAADATTWLNQHSLVRPYIDSLGPLFRLLNPGGHAKVTRKWSRNIPQEHNSMTISSFMGHHVQPAWCMWMTLKHLSQWGMTGTAQGSKLEWLRIDHRSAIWLAIAPKLWHPICAFVYQLVYCVIAMGAYWFYCDIYYVTHWTLVHLSMVTIHGLGSLKASTPTANWWRITR